jgi:hypothetical protein
MSGRGRQPSFDERSPLPSASGYSNLAFGFRGKTPNYKSASGYVNLVFGTWAKRKITNPPADMCWGQNAKLQIRQLICKSGYWHWGQIAKLHIRQRICKCGLYQVANSRPFRAPNLTVFPCPEPFANPARPFTKAIHARL